MKILRPLLEFFAVPLYNKKKFYYNYILIVILFIINLDIYNLNK